MKRKTSDLGKGYREKRDCQGMIETTKANIRSDTWYIVYDLIFVSFNITCKIYDILLVGFYYKKAM